MWYKLCRPKETYVPEEEEPKITEEKKEERVPYWHEVHFKGDCDIVNVWADEIVNSPFSGLFEFKLDGKIVAVIAEREVMYWIRTYD